VEKRDLGVSKLTSAQKLRMLATERDARLRQAARWDIQADVPPHVMDMFADVFRDSVTGITHELLDAMLAPLRQNEAAEHVTLPEFLLFSARLQSG